MFNNVFFSYIQKCPLAGEEDAPDKLLGCIEPLVVRLAASASAKEMQPWVKDQIVNPVLMALRGLGILLSPLPGFLGGSLQDMEYVNPAMAQTPRRLSNCRQ